MATAERDERIPQPPLHELVVAVAAPSSALSARSGDVDADGEGGGAHGFYHDDVRLLSRARLTLGGVPPTPVLGANDGPGRARFVGLAQTLGDARNADATVRVDRRRVVGAGRLTEDVTVTSTATQQVRAVLALELAADFQPVDQVKGGFRLPAAGTVTTARHREGNGSDVAEWRAEAVPPEGLRSPPPLVVVRAQGAAVDDAGLSWPVDLAPGTSVTVRWTATATGTGGPFGPHPDPAALLPPDAVPVTGDARLARLVEAGLEDLRGMLMAPRGRPEEAFAGAGAPWFLTLFGRDSLWAARMLLPLGTPLAAGTLRLLARLQGRRDDPAAQEEPGKILHEVRGQAFEHARDARLPPVYYGTVDATPLWVALLHDAWRWGMPPAEVEELLPALEAALGWMAAAAERGDGLLAYHDSTGKGLANQGWKDSGDAIRFADGRLAVPPVALAEVQGYAHEAATGGAALLEAFGRPGADRWRAWAAALAGRFRERYWVDGPGGPYPAMGLDGGGRPVDAVASNMGHLLGTGLLDAAEEAAVAARLTAPDMAGAYGLRTMAAGMGGYSPISYHCGSVWPHDTAIAVMSLARSGLGDAAGELVEGLLAAAYAFGGRLPELWCGDARTDVPAPPAYPAACRPQAWAAASGVAVLTALLGLAPDVPGGRLRVRPVAPSPVGAIRAHGLRLAGRPLVVEVDDAGHVTAAATDAPVVLDAG